MSNHARLCSRSLGFEWRLGNTVVGTASHSLVSSAVWAFDVMDWCSQIKIRCKMISCTQVHGGKGSAPVFSPMQERLTHLNLDGTFAMLACCPRILPKARLDNIYAVAPSSVENLCYKNIWDVCYKNVSAVTICEKIKSYVFFLELVFFNCCLGEKKLL